MKTQTSRYLWLLLLAVVLEASADEQLRSPQELYGELFNEVQMQQVYADGKSFVDMVPRSTPADVLEKYRRQRGQTQFDLAAFVRENFYDIVRPATGYHSNTAANIATHIDSLWPILTRGPDEAAAGSSLLSLPHPYVVPGGRFAEVYYWDSYFTMLGLQESGRHDLIVSMVDNFAALIDRLGHIPNGNRTYYLSRSQPPFFAAMVDLVVAREGDAAYVRYLPQLAKEHAFWMEGAGQLATRSAHRRVVRTADGSLLNRYWDDRATPREESYRQDVLTAQQASRPATEVYRNLRAAAESGWDFSSRWFADHRTLTSIEVVNFAPVDLNSLLYHLEKTLAKSYRLANAAPQADAMEQQAARRRAAMQRLMWDRKQGVFVDYHWQRDKRSDAVTAAAFYPLYFDIATQAQAQRTAKLTRKTLLATHGLLTTVMARGGQTGQQWDAPNGWAPLQWIAIDGLRRHGQQELASTIAQRWIARNLQVFRTTGKLLEKYDVVGDAPAGGGEYPLQDGFGWTSGVLRKLLTLYPAPAATTEE